MSWFRIITVMAMVALLWSCGGDSNSVGPVGDADIPYIDDTLVLDTSEWRSESSFADSVLMFDFKWDSLVELQLANDFQVLYHTTSSCDENHWLYDVARKKWRQIAPPWREIICADYWYEHSHLISSRQLWWADFVDDSFRLRLKRWREVKYYERPDLMQNYRIRAMRLHSGYRTIAPRDGTGFPFSQWTYDGKGYWMFSESDAKLYRYSEDGQLVAGYPCRLGWGRSLAWDGEWLWLSSGWGFIYQLDTLGQVRDSFATLYEYAKPIGAGSGRLWLGSDRTIYELDRAASLATGARVILDSIVLSIGVHALASDGANLYVTDGQVLQKLDSAGDVMRADSLLVDWAANIACYAGILHIECSGPKGLEINDDVITRLRMR